MLPRVLRPWIWNFVAYSQSLKNYIGNCNRLLISIRLYQNKGRKNYLFVPVPYRRTAKHQNRDVLPWVDLKNPNKSLNIRLIRDY